MCEERVVTFLKNSTCVVAALHSGLFPVCVEMSLCASSVMDFYHSTINTVFSIFRASSCKKFCSLLVMLTGMLDNGPSDPRRRKGVGEEVRKAGPAL